MIYFDFYLIYDNILKMDILGYDDLIMIWVFQDLLGINLQLILMDDFGVMSFFFSFEVFGVIEEQINFKIGMFGLFEFGICFVWGMLEDIYL